MHFPRQVDPTGAPESSEAEAEAEVAGAADADDLVAVTVGASGGGEL